MNLPNELQRAAQLLKADKKAAARELLVAYLKRQPESDVGWYLLSFALLNVDKQRQCLQRALAINPDMAPAKKRLQMLAAGAKRKAPAARRFASEPSRGIGVERSEPTGGGVTRSRTMGLQFSRETKFWLVVGGVVFVLAGLVGGVIFLRALSNMVRDRRAAAETAQAATTIAQQTAGAPVALPPTWTPTPQPEATATPTFTLTPTATVTATPVTPDPTTSAEMEIIEAQVANLRGLPALGAPTTYLISSGQVRPYLEASFRAGGGTEAEVDDMARVLVALGLIRPDYDLYTNVLNSLSDSLGGFYLPWSDEIFVIGTRFSGVERWVYSHEFTHALVDQHHGIDSVGVYPLCELSQDRCRAIEGVVEGDATLLMTQWLEHYASSQDTNDILSYTPPSSTLPEQSPPPYTAPDISFPYVQGLSFVGHFYERGGWSEVDLLYDDLPSTTEQILHPAKYLSGEGPQPVPEADIAPLLGEGWRALDRNTLGEWTSYLLLAYGAEADSQLEPEVAQEAAAGWGGDHYSVFYRDEADEATVVARWVWDTQGDADDFARALRSVQDGRFHSNSVDLGRGDCWDSGDEVSCVLTAGQDTLWLLAPDRDLMSRLQAKFPEFN